MIKLRTLIFLCALCPLAFTSLRAFSKDKEAGWSFSLVSGYTVKSPRKSFSLVSGYIVKSPRKSVGLSLSDWTGGDGQMRQFFSALEIARLLGRYEVGARIQNIGPTFITPFMKVNFRKGGRSRRFALRPSLSFGLVPFSIMGFWSRAELEIALRQELGISPFVGLYSFIKIVEDPRYEDVIPLFANVGIRLSLYY